MRAVAPGHRTESATRVRKELDVEVLLKLASYGVLIGYVVVSLFPLYWTFVTSMKSNDQIYVTPPIWWPGFTFENYVRVFSDRPFFFYMQNSMIIAVSVSVLCLLFGTLAGYGFSRDRTRAGRWMLFGVVSSRAIPPIALIVPFIVLAQLAGLFDTRLVMVIAGLFLWLPFVTWLMKGYFDSIPSSLIEAAMIDGCSQFQAFWRIVLPLVTPGLVSSAILTFIYTWNEFLYALALTSASARTLPVGLTDFFLDDTVLWNQLAGGTMIAILPPIIFVFLMQRQIVRGIIEGAVRG